MKNRCFALVFGLFLTGFGLRAQSDAPANNYLRYRFGWYFKAGWAIPTGFDAPKSGGFGDAARPAGWAISATDFDYFFGKKRWGLRGQLVLMNQQPRTLGTQPSDFGLSDDAYFLDQKSFGIGSFSPSPTVQFAIGPVLSLLHKKWLWQPNLLVGLTKIDLVESAGNLKNLGTNGLYSVKVSPQNGNSIWARTLIFGQKINYFYSERFSVFLEIDGQKVQALAKTDQLLTDETDQADTRITSDFQVNAQNLLIFTGFSVRF